jgi:co-chaperonin GroES (HSP10)
MPYMRMEHASDPADTIRSEMGDISDIEIFHNQVLVAVYIRPEKTKSGLFIPAQTREEDKYQGKVGLIIKKGADAFVDDSGKWFKGVNLDVGNWIYFRPSDGWAITVHGQLCRILDDTDIRGRIPAPDSVW